MSSPVRLQKLLAQAGHGSRRKCEEFILQGRVTVDGEVVDDLGEKVDPREQDVRLDGEPVRRQPRRYYVLNKPPGVVCTHRDPRGRPRAVDLVPDDDTRLFTVGRLDENSHGLLLVTNDGELAQRLAHPRYGIERRYRVQVAGRPTSETLEQLKQGLHFADGRFRVRGIKRLRTRGRSTILELTLAEGRNREIRRLFARVGHKVMNLQRVGFGPLRLGRLPEGHCRRLRPDELHSLRELARGKRPGKKKPASKAGRRTRK